MLPAPAPTFHPPLLLDFPQNQLLVFPVNNLANTKHCTAALVARHKTAATPASGPPLLSSSLLSSPLPLPFSVSPGHVRARLVALLLLNTNPIHPRRSTGPDHFGGLVQAAQFRKNTAHHSTDYQPWIEGSLHSTIISLEQLVPSSDNSSSPTSALPQIRSLS